MAATVPSMSHTILNGVIKTVFWADLAKSTKSEIAVKDASGNIINIYLEATTTLWDADAKAVLQDKLTVKSHVNVIYLTTAEGVNLAKSIKILQPKK